MIYKIIKIYFSFLIITICSVTAELFWEILFFVFLNFLFGKYFAPILGPTSDYLLGGPTAIVSKMFMETIPMVSPSAWYARIDSVAREVMLNVFSSLTGVIINEEDGFISNMQRVIVNMVTTMATGIIGSYDFAHNVLKTASVAMKLAGNFNPLAFIIGSYVGVADESKLSMP